MQTTHCDGGQLTPLGPLQASLLPCSEHARVMAFPFHSFSSWECGNRNSFQSGSAQRGECERLACHFVNTLSPGLFLCYTAVVFLAVSPPLPSCGSDFRTCCDLLKSPLCPLLVLLENSYSPFKTHPESPSSKNPACLPLPSR